MAEEPKVGGLNLTKIGMVIVICVVVVYAMMQINQVREALGLPKKV